MAKTKKRTAKPLKLERNQRRVKLRENTLPVPAVGLSWSTRLNKFVPYSKEMADHVLERMCDGESLPSIVEDMGIRKVDVRRWYRDDKGGFREAYDAARKMQAIAWEVSIIEDAETVEADPACIAKMRLIIDTKKWLMSKILPKRYGDKVIMEGGEKPVTHIHAHMTLQEAAEAYSRMLNDARQT